MEQIQSCLAIGPYMSRATELPWQQLLWPTAGFVQLFMNASKHNTTPPGPLLSIKIYISIKTSSYKDKE